MTAGGSADAEEVPSWYDEDQEPDDDSVDADAGGYDEDDEYDGSFVLDCYADADQAGPVAACPGELEPGDVFVLDPDAVEEVVQALEAPATHDSGWVVQVAAGRQRQVIGHVWLPAGASVYRLWHNRPQVEPFAGLELAAGQGAEPVPVAAGGTLSYRMVPLATATGVVDVVDASVELAGLPDRQLQQLLVGDPLRLTVWCGSRHESRLSAGLWRRIELHLTGPAAVDGRLYSWRTPRDLYQVVSVARPLAAPPSFLSTAAAARTDHPDEEE